HASCSCTISSAWSCPDTHTIASTTRLADCTSATTNTTCISPSFCSSGSSTCLDPTPQFNQGSGHTGHLEAHPSLLPKGNTSRLFWSVSNVSSCSITGNGETISGNCTNNGSGINSCASPPGGQTTAAINDRTTYTLTCAKIDSSSLSESATINVVPGYKER
ncbi:MAG: hypothetical protein RLZZ416_514, partial [Candidatus Parcubacteria bacterium]